jgi:hypothetical protein
VPEALGEGVAAALADDVLEALLEAGGLGAVGLLLEEPVSVGERVPTGELVATGEIEPVRVVEGDGGV